MRTLSTNNSPVQETWISRIVVKRLHRRIDFDVKLIPGINIIYGKNGLGKTTLLHIIANMSEMEIDRFQHLNFDEIKIYNGSGRSVTLEKRDGILSFSIDEELSSYEYGKSGLSEAEKIQVRQIIGERSTYLPAFRSILERMREGYYGSYEERKRSDFDELAAQELQALREGQSSERTSRRQQELASTNAVKTLRCRQWFGEFVPSVRYPSIMDVAEGLSEEWGSAQIAISRMEQKQFETAFVQIFTAIAEGDEGADELSEKDLLETISELIAEKDSLFLGPNQGSTYAKLVSAADNRKEREKNYNNLLQIYVDILNERKNIRESALAPINDFKMSVNEFLSEKKLDIGSRGSVATALQRRSSVYIEPDKGKQYGLTQLSSGERQIVTMLYSASRSSFRSGCCLIDEPELSLHIDWQRIILKHIEKQHSGRQIIACTHSPEVGADHESRVQFFSPSLSTVQAEDAELDVEEV